jgi:hypothetical protein
MTGSDLLFGIVVLNIAVTYVLLPPKRDDRIAKGQCVRKLLRSGALRRWR